MQRGSTLKVEWRFVVAPVCLAGVALIFGLLSPRFFTLGNFSSVGGQVSVLGALALGQMFALTVRGFDISVGAVAACSGTLAALAINKVGVIGIVAAPLAGLVFGTINGVLIGRFAIQPIIATLGVMIGTKGFALLISDNGQAVALNDPSGLTDLAFTHWVGLPPVSWALVVLTLLCWFFIARTTAGRRILMLGSNPDAAFLIGIDTNRVHIAAYQLCGLFAGLAGTAMLVRAGAGLPTDGSGMELQSIAAAVIGGTALTGGIVFAPAVLCGALFVQALLTGLNILGLSPFSGEVAIGAVIIAAALASRIAGTARHPSSQTP